MKKVLIVGPDFWGYNYSISRAFETNGFESRIIDFRELFGVYSKAKYLFSFNKSKSLENKIYINNKILKEYDNFKPEIVFVIKGTILFEETLSKLKNSIKILWMMDSIFNYASIFNMMSSFDYLFFFEKTDVNKLNEKMNNVYFLPLALDPKVYFPLNNIRKEIDLSFVGNLSDERIEMLMNLMSELKGVKMKFYGRRILPLNNTIKYYLSRDIFPNRNLDPNYVNYLYNNSKLCLNIHKSQSIYGVNQRFFEIIGSKSVQIVNSNPYILENFNRNDVFTFNSNQELIKLILELLKSFNKINLNNLYNTVIKNHTFHKRISDVISTIY